MMTVDRSRVGREFALEAVDVGWRVYSTSRFYAGTDPEAPDPLGGVVVDRLQYREIDVDTGELADKTIFRVLDYRHQWQHLDADEIDTSQLDGLNRAACYAAMRALISTINFRRRGQPTSDEIDNLRYAWALLKAAL